MIPNFAPELAEIVAQYPEASFAAAVTLWAIVARIITR